MTKIIQANCETGEVTERDMTIEEQELHDNMLLSIVDSEEQARESENLRLSASNKLKALGLTDQEISAIMGSV
jgi:hypothetical protein